MLYIDIFKLDWLLIDSIIIIILLIFLLSVKIFKLRSRWRHSFSNKALIKKRISKPNINDKENFYSIRKMNIVRNINLKDPERPKISIFNLMTKNKKINQLLTRGLSSYGFDVINLKIGIHNDFNDLKEEEYEEEAKKLIAKIKNNLQKIEITMISYLLILDPKLILPNSKMFFGNNNKAVLLINPKINNFFKRNFSNILLNEQLKRKLLVIFSKKTFLLFNNKNFKNFLNLVPDYEKRKLNVKILDKSRKSFKYYETFLLGMIIDFLEANL